MPADNTANVNDCAAALVDVIETEVFAIQCHPQILDEALVAIGAATQALRTMLKASEEQTAYWETEAIRLRRLLQPFAQHAVVRTGSGLDTIAIYVRRGAVRDACKEFA